MSFFWTPDPALGDNKFILELQIRIESAKIELQKALRSLDRYESDIKAIGNRKKMLELNITILKSRNIKIVRAKEFWTVKMAIGRLTCDQLSCALAQAKVRLQVLQLKGYIQSLEIEKERVRFKVLEFKREKK